MKKYLVLILFIFFSFFIYSFENTNIIKYILENDYHSLKTLLENGADIEQTDKFGNTPLFISILEPDKIEITKLLIHYGADVNAVDDFGQTPLIKSIYSKNIEAVELLLENGADIEFKDSNGNTPLFISILEPDKIDITKLLIHYGADVNAVDNFGHPPLIKAISSNNIEAVELLLKNGADPEIKDSYGNTSLFISISEPDKIDITKLLIHYGADVNAVDNLGQPPLIKAIYSNNIEAAKLLLENGADIEFKDCNGNTPLFISILEPDKIDITKLLIHYGADVNAVDNFGQTPLIKAIYSNNIEAVELLLKNGADIEQTNLQNRTPLIINISTNNNYEITKLLLNYGANINAQDIHNFTPLYYAVLNEDIILIKYLLQNGAIVYNNKYSFSSPYVKALSVNNPEIIKFFINNIFINEIKIETISSYSAILYPHINIGTPINFDLKETIISNRILILNVFLFLLISLLFFKNKKIIIFLPFIFILLFQLKYGHNMITWEEWENFNIYNVFKSHDYSTFFNLLTLKNFSHSIIIPRLIITFVSIIFGFYPLILMITATIFHFLSLILILKKNEFEKMPALYLFVISMFFFSLRQIENFFWGFQIAFLFCNLSSISCFYCTDNYLKSNKTTDLVKASILAIVASFSSLMGILCFIPLLYSQFKTRTRTIYLNVLIFCLIFFQNFEFLLKSSKSNFSIKEIFYIINSFFTYFGSALSHNIWFAYTAFLIFLISLLIVIKIKISPDCFFNWYLLFYSIGTGILIAFGRGLWGFDSGLFSRYSTFSITGLLALFFLLKKIERLKTLRYILLFSMLLSSVFYSFYGSISAKNIYNTKEFYWDLLFDENYGLQKIDYNIYFWDKNIIESNFPYIKND